MRKIVLLLILCLTFSCSSFNPAPLGKIDFKDRVVTLSDDMLSIDVAALSGKESKKLVGLDVENKNIQPVWIKINNKSNEPFWYLPIKTDRNYYSPAEVAYMNRFFFSDSKNRKLRQILDEYSIHYFVPPKSIISGFVYTNMDPGLKYVNVSLLGLQGIKSFRTVVKVPHLKADYQEVDFDKLYSDYIDCDLESLKKELEKLPCCTTDEDGKRLGDPLNLVFIGDVEDVITSLVAGGWAVTERISFGSVWRTIRSYLFRQQYRHAPVSSLYVFGRSQDAAFQKARRTVSERNHLRVWMTDLRLDGTPVWIGQISRDIGIKFTLTTGFLVTHVIDADVDNDRFYLIQDMAGARSLRLFGYVGGVGISNPDNPRFNLGGDSYYTDGLRAVMRVSREPVSFSKKSFLNWEFPVDVEEAFSHQFSAISLWELINYN